MENLEAFPPYQLYAVGEGQTVNGAVKSAPKGDFCPYFYTKIIKVPSSHSFTMVQSDIKNDGKCNKIDKNSKCRKTPKMKPK